MLDDVASLPLLSQGATAATGYTGSLPVSEYGEGLGSRFELLESVEGRGSPLPGGGGGQEKTFVGK